MVPVGEGQRSYGSLTVGRKHSGVEVGQGADYCDLVCLVGVEFAEERPEKLATLGQEVS